MATVEASILIPVVMLLVLLAIQIGLTEHARQSVVAAAQAGGQDTASVGGTVDTGKTRAESFLTRVAGTELRDTAVQVRTTDQTVTVEVTGSVVSLFPGWRPRVSGKAEVAVERLTW